MNIVFAAMVFVFSLLHAAGAAAQDNADAGKKVWAGAYCHYCHGNEGEGGFGPDLAGRRLSVEQFRHAVREPWGIMPAYTARQLSDQDLANLVAYFDSLPRVATPAPWHTPVPEGAPPSQRLAIASFGCSQCHDLTLSEVRRSGGNPESLMRIGNYSRARLPESRLQEIWQWLSVDVGLRVPVRGRLAAGVATDAGMTYTLDVENAGIVGKGLTAEDLTIALTLPSGSMVVNTSGAGYQGIRRDPQSGADLAVWTVARMAPKDRQTYAVTLSAPAAGAERLRGVVRWSRPALGAGDGDTANINPPPAS